MKKYIIVIGAFFVLATVAITLSGCASPSSANKEGQKQPQEQPQKQTKTESPNPTAEAAAETTTTTVKAYFSNTSLDPNKEFTCNGVFAVERNIPKTTSVGLAAIQELLKGPTDAEKAKGYTTNINTGVKVQKLTIQNSVAKVDFNAQLEYQVGGSCRITAIIAQIRQTLKQFPTIKSVIISIDGRTEDILQP